MKKGTISVISALLGTLTGAAVGVGAMRKATHQENKETQKMSDKHLALFLMMNQWVKVKQEGKTLESYFIEKGYKNIAIYGMSYAGETLVNELKDSRITVAYGIDKNADGIYADVDIVSLEDELPKVDAIVVTPITFFDSIKEQLSSKVSCPVISLEAILYEV